MTKRTQSKNEIEIDVIGIIKLIWSQKKIILSVLVAVLATVFIFEKTKEKSPDVFLGTTLVQPISIFDELEYKNFNYFNETFLSTQALYIKKFSEVKFNEFQTFKTFPSINKDLLINLFGDKINDINFLKKVVKIADLVDKKKYQDEQKYEEAVLDTASSMSILPPDNLFVNKKGIPYWRIEFKTNKLPQWEKFLQNIMIVANDEIRKHLEESFYNAINNEKELKTKIVNDIQFELDHLAKYQKKIDERKLDYLKEQAKIAPETNFAKEKEIDIIIEDEDQKLFTDGVIELEEKLRAIKLNSNISKLELLFKSTPILNSKDFVAAKIIPSSTNFRNLTNNNNASLQNKLIFAAIFALMTSIFIIIIINLVKNHK